MEEPRRRSQKDPPFRMDGDESLESQGLILCSPQRPVITPATLTSNIPRDTLVAEIRIIAESMDSRLATCLMREYVNKMLPQKTKIGSLLVDRVAFLQHSKPVL